MFSDIYAPDMFLENRVKPDFPPNSEIEFQHFPNHSAPELYSREQRVGRDICASSGPRKPILDSLGFGELQ